jgi:hypothetical protein
VEVRRKEWKVKGGRDVRCTFGEGERSGDGECGSSEGGGGE